MKLVFPSDAISGRGARYLDAVAIPAAPPGGHAVSGAGNGPAAAAAEGNTLPEPDAQSAAPSLTSSVRLALDLIKKINMFKTQERKNK
jgi:hypothetical protein